MGWADIERNGTISTFSEKMKKIYRLEVWILCKMHHRIMFFSALRLSVRRFQMPLEGLSFVKTLATFGIINAMDSHWYTYYMDSVLIHPWHFKLKTLEIVLICARQFFKIRLDFHTLYHWNWTKSLTPQFFFFISETSNSFSVRSRSLKNRKSIE